MKEIISVVSVISSETEGVTWSDNAEPLNYQTYQHLFSACLLVGLIILDNDFIYEWNSGEADRTAVRPYPKLSQIKPCSISGEKNASNRFRPLYSQRN